MLLYVGSEEDITKFWSNTGFVTDKLARDLGGLLVFAEHRYYGKSLPFGDSSFTNANLAFLSAEQALADLSVLVPEVRRSFGASGCPVIGF
jgi:hypothetical protein